MKKSCLFASAVFLAALIFQGSSAMAASCIECHTEKGVELKIPDTAPIQLMRQGEKRTVTLDDAYAHRGHPCVGVTIAFLAVRQGISLLCGSEIPEQTDMAVLTKSGAGGAFNFLDMLLKCKKEGAQTEVPPAMKPSRESFIFTVVRKSTHQAVDIQLKPDQLPEDFFVLAQKHKAGTATPEEWEKLHGYIGKSIMTFPAMAPEALFVQAQPYHLMAWGCLMPCKARCRHGYGEGKCERHHAKGEKGKGHHGHGYEKCEKKQQ
jgi:hypothetical protein